MRKPRVPDARGNLQHSNFFFSDAVKERLSSMSHERQTKVITKSKVGSLTMQPANHDVTGMPLYRMYPYPKVYRKDRWARSKCNPQQMTSLKSTYRHQGCQHYGFFRRSTEFRKWSVFPQIFIGSFKIFGFFTDFAIFLYFSTFFIVIGNHNSPQPWSSWTAISDKKYMELNGAALNVNKPCATIWKTAFLKDK